MLDKNNTTFKEDIEDTFKKEVVSQLQLHNDSMMATIDQRFSYFQSMMPQTLKDLIINMIPQSSNPQSFNIFSPKLNDMPHTQPLTYPYHRVFLQHPYPP